MNLKIEEFDVENIKSQLDQDTLNLNENSADILTQTLWKWIEINDKFAVQIIKVLCNEAWHHNKIFLVEYEKHENHLYFQERKCHDSSLVRLSLLVLSDLFTLRHLD